MAPIQPFIHRKVIVLHEDSPARQAARVMRERSIGCVMVADHQGHIVGVVTDRDLATRLLAEDLDPETRLSEVMTRDPVSVDENADISQVILLMENKGIRRVPVIRHLPGGTQKCVGMITLDDLIVSKEIDELHLVRIVRSQVRRRLRIEARAIETDLERRAMENFLQKVAERLGSKVYLSEGQVQDLTFRVLSALVGRLHHTGAMHLISQLPAVLQRSLSEVEPGPDSRITAPRLIQQVMTDFDLEEPSASLAITRLCMALEDLVDPHELERVKAQLPPDLRSFFAPGRVKPLGEAA